MSKLEAVPVTGIEVIPVKGGTAVFLVTAAKTMVIQVDPSVGEALQGALDGRVPDRPALETVSDTPRSMRSARRRIPSCRGYANSVTSTPVATTSARDHLTLVLGACGYLKQASVAESVHTTEQ